MLKHDTDMPDNEMNGVIVEFDKLLDKMNNIDHGLAVKKGRADLLSVQTRGSTQIVRTSRTGNTKILKLRNECDQGKYLKAKDDDNLQLGLLNGYLNGYAGKLGCNISKDKG